MVFVLNKHKEPVMPCSEKKARKLLEKGKAVIHRLYPMVIRLKEEKEYKIKGLRLKLDPGAKTTGFAVLMDKNEKEADAILLGEIVHKTTISDALEKRSTLRRGRRNRNTRYRPKRFDNRAASKRKGKLSPSLESRLNQTVHAVEKLTAWFPIGTISVEHVKFDTHLMQNPEIEGVGYQQGTLAGYEVREYLLEKFGRKCAYCGAENVPLEIEHIHPRSKGGTNRVDNLTIACTKCNQEKGNMLPEEWLNKLNKKKSKRSDILAENFKKNIKKAKTTLKDAQAVNTTRWRLFEKLKEFTPFVECGSGALTKMNRIKHRFPKEHYYDACCVGKSTPETINIKTSYVQVWTAKGRGNRKLVRNNKHGFPIARYRRHKPEYQTGDILKGTKFKGKPKEQTMVGRAVMSGNSFYFKLPNKKHFSFSAKNAELIQRGDGWEYSKKPINEEVSKDDRQAKQNQNQKRQAGCEFQNSRKTFQQKTR